MEPLRRIERSDPHPPVARVRRLERPRREDERQKDPREEQPEDEGGPWPDADGHLDVLA